MNYNAIQSVQQKLNGTKMIKNFFFKSKYYRYLCQFNINITIKLRSWNSSRSSISSSITPVPVTYSSCNVLSQFQNEILLRIFV